MKRLLTAIAVAVAVLTASAKVTDRQAFEGGSYADFEPSVQNEDSSAVETYDNNAPGNNLAVYDISGFGSKYLSLDTGDATLWRTNEHNAAYFDMVVKFTPSALGDEPTVNQPSDDKIIVYQNADSNIVVICADSSSFVTNIVTTKKLDAGTWARLTICSDWNTSDLRFYFKVYIDGVQLGTADNAAMEFRSLTIGTAINAVGFTGTGALDNFVARTTDPFFSGTAVANIGGVNGERYATLAEAIADADANVVIELTGEAAGSIALNAGQTRKIKANGYNCDIVGATGVVVKPSAPVDGVVTYEALEGVVYIAPDADPQTKVYYASIADAIPNCDSSNYVYIVEGKILDEAVTISAGEALYLCEGVPTYLEETKFTGTFDGAGTVCMRERPRKYVYTGAANGPLLFASGWTGTFQIGWNPASANARFVFGDFGNSNSTIEIIGDQLGNLFEGFMCSAWDGGNLPGAIASTIKLTGTWSPKDGFNSTGGANVISVLTGSGTLRADGASGYSSPDINYNITTLSNFTGTLVTGGNNNYNWVNKDGRGSFKIGNIITATVPVYGSPIVNLAANNGSKFKCRDLDQTKVNGESANLMIYYSETGWAPHSLGIYLKAAESDVDGVKAEYVSVTDATNAVSESMVVQAVTNTAPTVTIYDGTSLAGEDWAETSPGSGVYAMNLVKARYNGTGYVSLTRAIEAAGATESAVVELLMDDSETVTIPQNVTVVVDGANFGGRVSGSGVLLYRAGSVVPSFDSWTGTFVLDYDNYGSYGSSNVLWLESYGVNGSTIEIAEGRRWSGYIQNGDAGSGKTIQPTLKVSGTLQFNEGYNDRTNLLSKVTGAGTIEFEGKVSGDVRYGHCYVVQSLEDWSGTLRIWSVDDKPYTRIQNVVSGSGDVILDYKEAAEMLSVGENWRGTVSVGWSPAGAFNPNNFGNENSTVEMTADFATDAYFGTGEKVPLVIHPTLCIGADVSIKNGYSRESYNAFGNRNHLVTFKKLRFTKSQSVLTLNEGNTLVGNPDELYFARDYKIEELDLSGLPGRISVPSYCTLEIDKVYVNSRPGDYMIPYANVAFADGSSHNIINGSMDLYLNGEATGEKLEYATAGDGTKGLYLVKQDVSFVYDQTTYWSGKVAYGTQATAPAAPTRSGYDFTGWSPDTNDVIIADTTFIAQWSAINYTISYNLGLNDATNATDAVSSYTVNDTVTLLPAGCEGYKFNNWTNSSGEVVETISSGSTGDVTLYASWTLDEPETPTIPEVSPGTNTVYDCGTADNAAAVAAAMNNPATRADYIKAPAAAGITDGTTAASTYASYFSARVDGTSVVLELNEAGTNALETASTNVAANVAAQLSTIATTANATTAMVGGAQPGFYYRVVYDDSISGLGTETSVLGDAGLANAAGQVTLNIPAKKNGATAGFYRIVVDTAPSSGN